MVTGLNVCVEACWTRPGHTDARACGTQDPEAVILMIADAADLVLILADPYTARFNAVELTVMAKVIEAHRLVYHLTSGSRTV